MMLEEISNVSLFWVVMSFSSTLIWEAQLPIYFYLSPIKYTTRMFRFARKHPKVRRQQKENSIETDSLNFMGFEQTSHHVSKCLSLLASGN